ncbi:MAG: DUF365 domain-containing protein [Candidatus Atabeyarchaeum deiterrae]
MHRIVGVIYPVPDRLIDRLFDGGTKVFAKFLPRNFTRLRPKNKVIFYASRGTKKLVGEGTIVRVEFLTPDSVITRYREKLFLSEAEFLAYVKNSPTRAPSKEVLTLVLNELRKYSEPVAYHKPITMAGQYLTAVEYESFMRKKLAATQE